MYAPPSIRFSTSMKITKVFYSLLCCVTRFVFVVLKGLEKELSEHICLLLCIIYIVIYILYMYVCVRARASVFILQSIVICNKPVQSKVVLSTVFISSQSVYPQQLINSCGLVQLLRQRALSQGTGNTAPVPRLSKAARRTYDRRVADRQTNTPRPPTAYWSSIHAETTIHRGQRGTGTISRAPHDGLVNWTKGQTSTGR